MFRQFLCLFLAVCLFPAAPKLNKEQRALHAASRLTFGPTASDLAAIQKLGVDKWVNRQLQPGKIAEDPLLVERLKRYASISMTNAELMEKYPFRPGQGKAAAGNVGHAVDTRG